MKDVFFIAYNWASVTLWYVFILVISSIPNLDVEGNSVDWTIRSVLYALMYAFLFLLCYRALLATLRSRVARLRYWKSKREKAEDAEFARIIELLIFIIAFMATVILSVADEYHQSFVAGRIADIIDVLINIMGIAASSIILFKFPIVSELEELLYRRGQKR